LCAAALSVDFPHDRSSGAKRTLSGSPKKLGDSPHNCSFPYTNGGTHNSPFRHKSHNGKAG
jgi:hypothetical protein